MYQHPRSSCASAFTKFASILAGKQRNRRRGRSRSTPMCVGTHTFEALETRTLLTTTMSPVWDSAGALVENATSSLTRTNDNVSLTVDTVGLAPGVYTVSVIAFNSPENCKGECGPDDYEREEVNVSTIFGAGAVVGQSGEATFTAQVSEGDTSGALFGPGIVDTFEAEVRFVIHSKGPVIPDQLEEQLTTLDGGCPSSGCVDVQNGLHMSPLTQVTVSPVDLIRHVPFPNPGAVSRLTRYEDRVAMRIDTVELQPGAYTTWLVAFNNPEQCQGGCGADDLDREEVNASVMWGTGEVVDEGGQVTFMIHRSVEDKSRIRRGPGLLAPFGAEIHAPVRTHGPVIPELLEEQLTTLNGGCPPNTCENVHATAHFPNQGPAPNLLVTSLEATETGFEAEFSTDLDANALNLYDSTASQLGPADVVLQGATSGPVAGSLVVDPSLSKVTFIKSGGPLVADTYTVTLRGASDGFKSRGGKPLEGNGNGIAANDFGSSFTVPVAESSAITVSIPDFVRGPGQNVNLPADATTGIPLSISEGTNVRNADLRISYDPALLEITEAVVGADVPAGATVVLDATTPGLAILNFSSSTPLPAGSNTIVNLQATVPATNVNRIYGTQQVLDVHSVTITDGSGNEFPVIANDALHFVSYFGDVSGNGRINASDAAQVARVAALLDSGFSSSPLVDPNVTADISGNGRINATDASLLAQFAALLDVPEVPAIPGEIVIAGVGGPGQRVNLPQTLSGVAPAPLLANHSSSPTTTAGTSDRSENTAALDVADPIPYPAVDAVMADSGDRTIGDDGAKEMAQSLRDAIDELLSVSGEPL